MRATAGRRGFGLASAGRFFDWTRRAYAAGHLVFVAVHEPGGELVAGATFYRHGRRWTYANAADDPRFRKAYPGAVRLVVWEAFKRALAEGRAEMDLGGVDVPGARRRPEPGEPAHGMLTFKESFGARWIELTGAHERVLSPARYALGRVTARLATAASRSLALREALFLPRVGVVVVAVALPEPEDVVVEELEAADPLRALPEIALGDEQPERPAVLGLERLAVERVGQQDVVVVEHAESGRFAV